jgi:transmembrane 9 superfamily protein 2/4
VPFGTLVALLLFWFALSLPLVFLGSFLGFRRDAVEPPVRTNAIPRQVTTARVKFSNSPSQADS